MPYDPKKPMADERMVLRDYESNRPQTAQETDHHENGDDTDAVQQESDDGDTVEGRGMTESLDGRGEQKQNMGERQQVRVPSAELNCTGLLKALLVTDGYDDGCDSK
jgi:hypothetical protein